MFTLEKFETLKGRIISKIEHDGEENKLRFFIETGEVFEHFHDQDCCEVVYIEDICGDLEDLIGSEILQAEEVKGESGYDDESEKSFSWTFYKLGTIKGCVTIRWYGSSNGCYSESASLYRVK